MRPEGLAPVALAFLAGALHTAAFAPLGAWPLGPLALAVLIMLWRGAAPRRAALLGFVFGLGWFGSGVSWVYVSMHDYGGMPVALAGVATLAFAAYLALWPALAGALQAAARSGNAWFGALVTGASWALSEWLRGWVFTGFPWLATGYAHTDGPLAGFAPVVGVHGLNAIAALVAALLAQAAARRSAPGMRVTRLAAVAVVALGGALLARLEWTMTNDKAVNVALVQGNVPQDLKFEEGRFEATLALYERLATSASAELVVLPETALPRFLQAMPVESLARLDHVLRTRGADLVTGVPFAESRERYFNSAVSFGASPAQRYDKAHLVPFGEFIPAGFRWFVDAMRIPLGDFSRGSDTPSPLALGSQQVAINICYEDLFGEEIIRQLPRATLLANLSNIAWFGDSLAPHQHLQISRMRSLETGRPMLRATNTGMTAVIDARGRVTDLLPPFTEGVLTARVRGYRGATPYVRAGNWPAIGCAVLVLLAAFVVRARGRAPG